MTNKANTKTLIREMQENVAKYGRENNTTYLMVQAITALQQQDRELEAVGAGGVQALKPPASGEEQHARDSAELRKLCGERDQARRERDIRIVEIAGLEACIGKLRNLITELLPNCERYQYLRGRPLNAIDSGGVFAGKTPENFVLNGDDLDTAIDAAIAAQEGSNA